MDTMNMIERTGKIEKLIEKVGGRFELTVLIQKRIKELNQGSRPLVDVKTKYPVDIVLAEIEADKIALVEKGESETKSV